MQRLAVHLWQDLAEVLRTPLRERGFEVRHEGEARPDLGVGRAEQSERSEGG